MIIVQDLIACKRAGEAIDLPCLCTANEHALRALLPHAKQTDHPTVVEATCNQVNQDDGCTEMMAADFMTWLSGMAAEAGVPMEQLIFEGGHLGPNASPIYELWPRLLRQKRRVILYHRHLGTDLLR